MEDTRYHDDDTVECEYCGGDGYLEWELKHGACQTCIVEACLHTEIYREYIDDDSKGARFQETCIECGVYRRILCNWSTMRCTYTHWQHDEINMEDIA